MQYTLIAESVRDTKKNMEDWDSDLKYTDKHTVHTHGDCCLICIDYCSAVFCFGAFVKWPWWTSLSGMFTSAKKVIVSLCSLVSRITGKLLDAITSNMVYGCSLGGGRSFSTLMQISLFSSLFNMARRRFNIVVDFSLNNSWISTKFGVLKKLRFLSVCWAK